MKIFNNWDNRYKENPDTTLILEVAHLYDGKLRRFIERLP